MTTGVIDPRYGDASATRHEVRGQEFMEVSSYGDGHGGAWGYGGTPTKVTAFGDAHGQTTYRL